MLEYRALFAVSEAAVAIEKFDVALVSKEKITPGVLHMTFKRCDGTALDFVPGQFITFLLDGPEGQVKRRSYSVATIPGQTDLIEIAISEVKGGIATETLFNLDANKPLHAIGRNAGSRTHQNQALIGIVSLENQPSGWPHHMQRFVRF